MTRHSKVHKARFKSRLTKKGLKFFHALQKLHESYQDIKEGIVKALPAEIYLSHADRITHVSLRNTERRVVEVINVSYEINIDGEWITIVRFDSHHNYLHRHIRISLDDEREIEDTVGVKKKGEPALWYTWAIQYIKVKFIEYRTKFTKRSLIQNLGY